LESHPFYIEKLVDENEIHPMIRDNSLIRCTSSKLSMANAVVNGQTAQQFVHD